LSFLDVEELNLVYWAIFVINVATFRDCDILLKLRHNRVEFDEDSASYTLSTHPRNPQSLTIINLPTILYV